MLDTLKINPEFEKLIPPLTDDEFELLESNILSEGEIFTPIFTWNGFIIDGHHRYQILSEHPDINYRVTEKDFPNKYAAMSWICNNQLGRRNLTEKNKIYLIGKRYEAEKYANGASDGFRGNQYVNLVGDTKYHVPNEDNCRKTRKKIANECGKSEAYVQKADSFAKGVDAADEAVPGTKKDILSGAIKRPAYEIAAIAKAPPEERRELTENLRMPRPSSKKPSREMSAMIGNIKSDMRKIKPAVSEEGALGTLCGAIDLMIESCEMLFDDYPRLLSEKQYFTKVMDVMQRAINYVEELKGETFYA